MKTTIEERVDVIIRRLLTYIHTIQTYYHTYTKFCCPPILSLNNSFLSVPHSLPRILLAQW